MDVADIEHLFAHHLFRFPNEATLQQAIADCLLNGHVPFEREVRLGPGARIDFLCGGNLGIEVKIDGQPNDVLRQLGRYAESDRITSLVLVTTRLTLALQVPPELGGKPLKAIRLGNGVV